MGYVPGQQLGPLQATLTPVTGPAEPVTLGQVDGAGIAWYLSGLDGWDSPDTRTLQYAERQADHGSWPAPTYLTARVLTLTGTIAAQDQASLETAMQQLHAAVGLADIVLAVSETTPKQCVVRRSGKLLIQRQTDRTATYSVLVTAADPRRYATTVQSATTGLPTTAGGLAPPLTPPLTSTATSTSGTVTATNTGTIATRPLFTVAGPAAQPAIITTYPDGSSRVLSYSDALAAGDVLTIDTDARTVVLNGAASRRRYLSGSWPEIPAGTSVTIAYRATTYDPSAALTASWRAAWL